MLNLLLRLLIVEAIESVVYQLITMLKLLNVVEVVESVLLKLLIVGYDC